MSKSTDFKRAAAAAHEYDPFACCLARDVIGGHVPRTFMSVFSFNKGDEHIAGYHFEDRKEIVAWSQTALCFAAAMARRGDI